MASKGMIAYFDYRPGYESQREEFDEAIARVLASGKLILGEEVEAFEEEFARFIGVQHAIGVGNGTDAITLSLRALGLGPGDEILTVGNAGVAPIAGIRAAGATPRLLDVHPETLLLDPAHLERALTEKTRAILPVHLYGNPAELDALSEFAERNALLVIEDCAQAHGARFRGRPVGSRGAVGCFSFYPTKNLGAFGDGGICVTDDSDVASRIREQRMYGFREDGFAHVEGMNSRLDELQAAILRVRLAHFEGALSERRELAALYRKELRAGSCALVEPSASGDHAYHLFVIQVSERKSLCDALARAGVGYAIHYPVPVHRMDAYAFLDRPGELVCSEAASERVVSLPLYPGLAKEAVLEVSQAVSGWADRNGDPSA